MVALLRIANLLSTSAHALSIRVNIKTECARIRQVPSLYLYSSSSKPVDFRAALVSGTIVQVRRQPVSSLSSLNTMVLKNGQRAGRHLQVRTLLIATRRPLCRAKTSFILARYPA